MAARSLCAGTADWKLAQISIYFRRMGTLLAAVPENPAVNTLIAQTADGLIAVYRLTTGEIQINMGPDFEGKLHVTILDKLPPDVVSRFTQ